ncbi:MAG: glycosyltransferase [Candidatus Saccharimonadales bacterium]
MNILLILFVGAAALELLVHIFGRAQIVRRALAIVSLVASSFIAGASVMAQFNLLSVLILLLSLYRAFNMVRVVEGRMHEAYLRRATRRTSFILMLMQIVVFGAWWTWGTYSASGFAVWTIIGSLQAVIALLLVTSTLRSLRRTTWPLSSEHYSDKELPTVTVAIPARNETEDLQQCLQTVIASDYPKLEIIVLDDCSQLRRTPEIIKEFAHAGVRFVQGHEPRETWLPKNEAYDRLAGEATGQYILFCGVDVRFAPHSVRDAITVMLSRKKKMLSVLPQRQQSAIGHFSLVQAMRYWWELVPPRRFFNRPPVISSCWVIESSALQNAGGFAAVARSIVPEAHFARQLIVNDEYSFLRSSDALGVESNKHVADQHNTAVRMRYPQMHRRPEQTALITLLELFFLVLPFVLTIVGFLMAIGTAAHMLAVIASLLLIAAYELTVLTTRVNTWWFGLVAQPFAVLVDIGLLHYSMWKYEFSTVDWKGRNVCVPVMHVVPHLPSVKKR